MHLSVIMAVATLTSFATVPPLTVPKRDIAAAADTGPLLRGASNFLHYLEERVVLDPGLLTTCPTAFPRKDDTIEAYQPQPGAGGDFWELSEQGAKCYAQFAILWFQMLAPNEPGIDGLLPVRVDENNIMQCLMVESIHTWWEL